MTNKPFNFSKFLFILSLSLTFGFFSCSDSKKEQTETTTEEIIVEEEVIETQNTMPSLTEQLSDKANAFKEKADPEKVKTYEAAIQKVTESGIIEKSKKEGDKAPNFTLPNATGQKVTLTDLTSKTKNGYTIITWYRGGWCPYCNLTLAAWQDILPEIQAENIELIAITPELPDSTLSTKEKNALEFEVLSDVGNKVAKEYGIVFPLDQSIREAYKNMGLEKYNGDASYTLPLAATYVINSENEIVYSFLDADYKKRAEPKDVLQRIKDMK